MRALSEAFLESLPQLCFQVYAFFYCGQNECGFEIEGQGVLLRSISGA